MIENRESIWMMDVSHILNDRQQDALNDQTEFFFRIDFLDGSRRHPQKRILFLVNHRRISKAANLIANDRIFEKALAVIE